MEKDAEASKMKRENDARIKQEIALIEEQESKIKEKQKQLLRKKSEKQKAIQSKDHKPGNYLIMIHSSVKLGCLFFYLR